MSAPLNCLGHYYIVGPNKYRRVLYLGYNLSQASDVLVVMMNPGGSQPLNNEYNDKLTVAKQDKTQNKIQVVMEKMGWNKATVINLSDLIETKSWRFNKRLKEITTDHSIFHPSRREELKTICDQLKPNATVLVAWGVAKETFQLRESAYNYLIEKLGPPVGYAYGKDEYSFLHPLAYKFGKGEFQFGGFKWDLHMIEKINESNRNS